MKKAKWSNIDSLCKAVEAVAGLDIRCWVEHAEDVVAGERPDRPVTPCTQRVGGQEGAEVVAFVSGRTSRKWVDLLGTVVRSELDQQRTIHDMAAATARAWRQMNALLTMASSSSLGVEAGKTIQKIFDMLVRATRFDGGIAVVRLPGSEDCLQLDATGVQRLPQDIVDGLEQLGSGVYTFLPNGDNDPVRRACVALVEPYQPAAVARLQTENDMFGWLLAAAAEEVSSDDLKLFGAAARIIAVALENSHTLTIERAATRVAVERELYQALAKTAPVGMFRTDAAGSVLYVNDRWCRVTGATEAEALRDGWVCAVHPEDRARVSSEWERMLVEGAPVRCEHRCCRGDGEVWVLTVVEREAREDGGFVGTMTDITDRKRAEQEKAELEQHLRHAHKMQAVGTMAGGIAHDFNNILGAIVGNAELAIERVPEGDRGRVHLDRLLKGAFRARALIGQLLAFSRQTERVRAPQEVGAVVAETVDLIRASVPAGIELQTDIATPDARVSADATQLHQVILNLCTNAAEAIGDNEGRIRVALERVELDVAAAARLGSGAQPGAFIRLSVSDTGPGVSEELRDRIFEPFFSTKFTRGGSGMGLAMVHGIVTDHGGFVRVTNDGDAGARFEVYLPEFGSESGLQAAELRPALLFDGFGAGAVSQGFPSHELRASAELFATEAAAASPPAVAQDRQAESRHCVAPETEAGSYPEAVAQSDASWQAEVPSQADFAAQPEVAAQPAMAQPPADESLEDLVAAFLAEEKEQPEKKAGLADETLSGLSVEPPVEPQGHTLARSFGGLPALRPGAPRRAHRLALNAPAPELDTPVPPAFQPTSSRPQDEDSLLERLVAEFLAEEARVTPHDAGTPAGPTVRHGGAGTDGASVPAVRHAGVPTRSRLIERAPEFRRGHARLLGGGRSAGSAARGLPSGCVGPALPAPEEAAPQPPEPTRQAIAEPAADTTPRSPLPFPYGLPTV